MFGTAEVSRLNPSSACRFLAFMPLMVAISCVVVISLIPRMPAYCRAAIKCSTLVFTVAGGVAFFKTGISALDF
jgi:hypothetical protein